MTANANGSYRCRNEIKVNRYVFFIAQYPVRWTAQSVLHCSYSGSPVHSDTNSTSLERILATQQLRAYSLIFPTQSIDMFSFIQLSRLRRRGEKQNESRCCLLHTCKLKLTKFETSNSKAMSFSANTNQCVHQNERLYTESKCAVYLCYIICSELVSFSLPVHVFHYQCLFCNAKPPDFIVKS